MTIALVLSLLGLALVDSLNTSTIYLVVLIILGAKKPKSTGIGYIIGAFLTFLAGALVIYFGLSALPAKEVITSVMRVVVFSLIAVLMVVFAIRSLKSRPRKSPSLPSWINPWTAFFVGALATIGDLPNAFPMFLAVNQLLENNLAPLVVVITLVLYTFIYILPTLIIFILGIVFNDKLRSALQKLLSKFTTGYTKPSWKKTTLFIVGAIAALVLIPLTL